MRKSRVKTRKAKPAKKTAKKLVKKPRKTTPKKPTKKAVRKPVQKAVKKPAKSANSAKRATTAPSTTTTVKRSTKKPAFNPKTDSANDPNWVAPVWDDDLLLGAHVSTAGGTHDAPPRARAIGATRDAALHEDGESLGGARLRGRRCSRIPRRRSPTTHVRATIAHDSYLINLASPDDDLRRRSIESFVAELQRCEHLG